MIDLAITQGDEKAYNLTLKSGTTAQDITGATVTMTVKRALTDSTPAFPPKVVTTHTDAVNGKTTITLTTIDTSIGIGKYYYDVQIVGGGIPKKTVIKGRLEITWQVTED